MFYKFFKFFKRIIKNFMNIIGCSKRDLSSVQFMQIFDEIVAEYNDKFGRCSKELCEEIGKKYSKRYGLNIRVSYVSQDALKITMNDLEFTYMKEKEEKSDGYTEHNVSYIY